MKKQKNTIYYGMGKNYLLQWGIQQALREIYQNFFDYGIYTEKVIEKRGMNIVSISNDWNPDSLDFLRIGQSIKSNNNSIGKHGEGLKMAFLIFFRMGYKSRIFTQKYVVYPSVYNDKEVGECFCLIYEEHNIKNQKFKVQFEIPKEEYIQFYGKTIRTEDVIFDDGYWGQIVDKPKGEIYSGGLFVAKVENISKAYNINPAHMKLDRDRCVPRAFDVNYSASKIQEAHGKWTAKDVAFSDTEYIERIPEEIKKDFKPVLVGKNIEFTYKNEKGEAEIVSNNSVKKALKSDSFFARQIKKMKKFIAKRLGLYDLLIEFRDKHIHSTEARADFDVILDRINEKKAAKETEAVF